jgi:hypothetical protein
MNWAFNIDYKNNNLSLKNLKKIIDAAEDPWIVHFAGKYKPSSYLLNHPYKKSYYELARKTPWKYEKTEDITVINILKKLLLRYPKLKRVIKLLLFEF